MGGETQSGVADPGHAAVPATGSAVGGVATSVPARHAEASTDGGASALPFTGYDALLFAGVGFSLLGLGITLRVLVGRAMRRGAS